MTHKSVSNRTCRTLRRVAIFTTTILLHSITHASAMNITLQWDENTDNPTGYKLYYGKTSSTNQTTIDLLSYNGTGATEGNSPITLSSPNMNNGVVTYEITNLPDGNDYYFVVTAYNDETSESDPSNEVTTVDYNKSVDPANITNTTEEPTTHPSDDSTDDTSDNTSPTAEMESSTGSPTLNRSNDANESGGCFASQMSKQ